LKRAQSKEDDEESIRTIIDPSFTSEASEISIVENNQSGERT